ncbi:hypothetical protein [Rhizobium laguerreae]|uniref:hypothetical protein n=1 Tax=Rhizobium laguerreae TaxID=1076926 RepID=UPI0014417539|nr:hypothetical protein [Rhizobium laguerreae]NKM69384.1 hypothetical protein [Rhizobium laguerreae]
MAGYENRLILFIDFLGFQEHVDRTVAEASFLDRLVEALAHLREVGMEQEVFPSQQMTHFSDSVVLSFRIEERSAVFWMLTQIRLAIIRLAGNGFLVRGAVTVGPLFHTPEALVGPAMVTAYHMESRVAVYPRVIIDPTIIQVAREHRSTIHHADEEERYVRGGVSMAADGQLWIDYISYKSYLNAGADPDGYPSYLERLGRLIRTGLLHVSVDVARKFVWLQPYYSSQIGLFAGLKVQDHPEAEAQRLFVAGLPALATDMADALARIQAADGVTQLSLQ